MCASAKIQNRLEKSANNKEYGKKRLPACTFFCFTGIFISLASEQHMEIVEKGSINDLTKIVFIRSPPVLSNSL